MNYTTISISDLRTQLPEVAERVARTGEVFAVEKWGKIKGYFVPNLAIDKGVDTKKIRAERIRAVEESLGMWRGREEMRDSVKWVRELRKSEDNRSAAIPD